MFYTKVALLLFTLLKISLAFSQNSGCFKVLRENIDRHIVRSHDATLNGKGVLEMNLLDGTDYSCLERVSTVFTNDGMSVLCGYKDGGRIPIKTTSFSGREISHLHQIHKFVVYTSRDGVNWERVELPEIERQFTDTIQEAIRAYDYFYDLSTDGRAIYLSYIQRHRSQFISSSKPHIEDWYYRTFSGKDWEKVTVDKNLGWSPVFENSSTPILNGKIPTGRNKMIWENGKWVRYNPSLRIHFPVQVGRKIYYHGYANYQFKGLSNPYYPFKYTGQYLDKYQIGEKHVNESFSNFSTYTDSEEQTKSIYPEAVYMASENSKVMFAVFHGQMYRSMNGGNTFESIEDRIPVKRPAISPICPGGTMFISGKIKEDRSLFGEVVIFRSDDLGNTWVPIHSRGLAHPPKYDVDIRPDGTPVLMPEGAIKLKDKCEVYPSTSLSYGTTVITHGTTLGFDGDPLADWTFEMAKAILYKANYGNVYLYKPDIVSLGEGAIFRKLIDRSGGRPIGQREDIIIFDWSSEANRLGPGFTESAGDALFASLLVGHKKEMFGLDSLHFIGHGRGCIVNSLAVERLLAVRDDYGYKDISIGQVTNIGPFDMGYTLDLGFWDLKYQNILFTDVDDAHPDISIATPEATTPNNGIISWKDIPSDTYFQQNGKIYLESTLDAISEMLSSQLEIINQKIMDAMVDSEIKKITQAVDSDYENLDSRSKAILNANRKAAVTYKAVTRKNLYLQLAILAYNTSNNVLFSNVDERPVEGSLNFEWSEYKKSTVIHPNFMPRVRLFTNTPVSRDFSIQGYVSICEVYINSIWSSQFRVFDDRDGGYSLSRLNGSNLGKWDNTGARNSSFSFYNRLEVPQEQVNRTRGVMNGSFDRVPFWSPTDLAGWSSHGGGAFVNFTPTGPFHYIKFENGYASMAFDADKAGHQAPMVLSHNMMYLPPDVNSVSLDIRTENIEDGLLMFQVEDLYNEEVTVTKKQKISEEIEDFTRIDFDVSNFAGHVVLIRLFFSDGGEGGSDFEPETDWPEIIPVDAPTLYIDNVELRR